MAILPATRRDDAIPQKSARGRRSPNSRRSRIVKDGFCTAGSTATASAQRGEVQAPVGGRSDPKAAIGRSVRWANNGPEQTAQCGQEYFSHRSRAELLI